MFRAEGLDFCYVPAMLEDETVIREQVRYRMPWLEDADLENLEKLRAVSAGEIMNAVSEHFRKAVIKIDVSQRYRASCRVKRDLEPGCTNPCRGSTLAGHLIYWGKRKLRISASSQVQVPGDRDLAYMNARDPAASPVPQPVRRLRTGCGVGLGHAAAGPEAGGFQTICVTDMRDAQPT